MTISPLTGFRLLSTITMSPGRIPASFRESPVTLRRNVASLFWIKRSSREMVSISSSSAGDGNPASIVPNTFVCCFMDRGISLPLWSLFSNPVFSSLLTILNTEFLDLSLNNCPISEKLGILPDFL